MSELSTWLLERLAEDEAWTIAGRDCRCSETDAPEPDCPARVLATVKAHRAIMEEHAPHDRRNGIFVCRVCDWNGGDGYPCDTLRALASIYADAPGFREEWR